MASGFVQRFKGKVDLAQLWLGEPSAAQNGPLSVVAYTTAGDSTLSGLSKIETIASSSAISIWTLGYAPQQGIEHVLNLISVSSGVFIKAKAGTAFNPSTATVIKSTYAMTITLIGASTTNWAIKSVFPPSTAGVSPLAGITLSTTT